MAKNPPKPRTEGMIRRRGNSFQAILYAGTDPVTGRQLYLRGSSTDEAEAKKLLRKFKAQVAEQRHAKTRASLRTTIESWLETHELEESTRENYVGYAERHIYPVLGDEPIGKVTTHVLERLYAEFRRCGSRCDGRPYVAHRVDGPHECREVRHKRPPGRPPAAGYPPHDCAEKGCLVVECRPHLCAPLAAATIRKIHFVIRGAMTAAQRWGWITTNPAELARIPRLPAPDPNPPTTAEAAALVAAAWEEDPSWGTLVWLVMVTGMRRAELLALRWSDFDLAEGLIYVRRNHVRVTGKNIEKDTKTHRARRITVDQATVELLSEHHQRYSERCGQLGLKPVPTAYLFSYSPTNDRPCNPSGVTHRYRRMCERLDIDSHLHALRHYSATELLAAGVDLRTVAGRLGHGGGGATTLRVYAAWLDGADRRAAEILGSRLSMPNA
ncbi:integrase family protein [Pseudonocardia dioxanivorans CB1190]|uniref:Integrase family protein n=1 Tax=Pseudonocardia dioxanivorans (strain ATCC 55486 / DSM 44775 / JCM 13855 / CB1190) TaxID=675635 RepID=F4D253_PSEUX|nr:tyrosine-type recombinase/integrase [Pseudonocardia dioxanivorans]AEA22294.1 integrase family protein [Pseudonocardia dioxanivorans CB1190]